MWVGYLKRGALGALGTARLMWHRSNQLQSDVGHPKDARQSDRHKPGSSTAAWEDASGQDPELGLTQGELNLGSRRMLRPQLHQRRVSPG